MSDQAILVTGAAGFIGFHVARQLLARDRHVVGLDTLNNYYDPALKQARLSILREDPRFGFVQTDLADRSSMAALFAKHRFEVVVHLAAQAGVRYSIDHPHAYVDANIEGFINVLEGCRHNGCKHLLFASSSSVYGANTKLPFSVQDNVDHPISLYAASKKANELMAHTYSHLYRLPATGLRFFTVYGPWGRPGHGDVSSLPRPSSRERRSDCSITATCAAISPSSTMSARRSSALSIVRRRAIRIGPATGPIRRAAPRRGRSTTSATTIPKSSCTWFHCWRRSSAAPPPRRCCRCSPATCRQPMLMSKIWRATSDFGRRPRLKMVSHGLRNGIVIYHNL